MAKKKNGLKVALYATSSVFLALSVALTVSANLFREVANTYLGRGEASVVKIEGSEDWDTQYYQRSFNSREEAAANSEAVTQELCEEGFVLLKNKDRALPLDAPSTQISLIGRGSVNALYGGSGSGNVDVSKAATPYKGIEQAGFKMDQASYNYFTQQDKEMSGRNSSQDIVLGSIKSLDYSRCSITMDNYDDSEWLIGEVANTDYTKKPFSVVDGDTAVYVISRAGGEGGDLSNDLKRDAANSKLFKDRVAKSPDAKAEYDTYVDGQHQLELTTFEKNWLKFCQANYAKTIVVINSSNAMELGELQDDNAVDAIVWVGGPGSTGFNALGNILSGKVNPSGKTADLYARDFTKDPTFVNASVARKYNDIDKGDIASGVNGNSAAYMTQYEEGIYVGYRYYETAAVAGTINYDEAVVYPFGYGLSYTNFEKSVVWSETAEAVTATVTVKNVGELAGKEVVQIYYTAPYTAGGIEKSAVVLGGFAKTKLLESNATDTLTVTIAKKDMASYDYKGLKVANGGYILEKGAYTLSLRENSHTVSEATDATYTMNVANDVIYNDNVELADGGSTLTKQAATNHFNDVSAIFKDTATAGYALNFSRADFNATFPTAPTAADLTAGSISLTYKDENGETVTKTVKEMLKAYSANDNLDETAEMPKTGEVNGLSLSHMRGLAYDDEAWDSYLDQLTEEDYKDKLSSYLISCAYNTAEISSLQKPAVKDFDGPQGFSTGGDTKFCAYCSEVIIASTFNVDLAKKMGEAIGEEALAYNAFANNGILCGWYAPAMNTHRSPFAGRNFEYYSEDPVLGGMIACSTVEGAADKGVYCTIKHFALNDTEIMRTLNQCTWANEQTMREIYFKPFQIVVENAKTTIKYIADEEGTVATRDMSAATAVMSSFNRVGTTWAGGSYALQTEVLRNEWGFRGFVISDFNLYNYMNSDQGVRAGTDIQLTFGAMKGGYADVSNATTRQAARKAIKNVCYTVANSNAMQGVAPGSYVVYGMAWWEFIVIAVDVFAGALVLGSVACIVMSIVKAKKH